MKFLLRFFKWVLSLFVKKEIQEQEVMSALDRSSNQNKLEPNQKRTPKEYGHYLQSKGLQKWQRKN